MVYDQNEKLITAKDFNFAKEFGQEWYDSLLESLLNVEGQDPLVIRQLMNESISLLDVWTPYTYTEYFNSYIGSYMGFTFTKKSNLKDLKNAEELCKGQ